MLNTENGFNPKNLEVLRGELNRVLNAAGFENLEFDTGRIKYTSATCTVPLEIKIKGMITMDDEFLALMMKKHNLVKERNGAVLTGYKTSRPKYPFSYEKNGKSWKATHSQARELFGDGAFVPPTNLPNFGA